MSILQSVMFREITELNCYIYDSNTVTWIEVYVNISLGYKISFTTTSIHYHLIMANLYAPLKLNGRLTQANVLMLHHY